MLPPAIFSAIGQYFTVGAYQADPGALQMPGCLCYQLEANGSSTSTKVTAPDGAAGDQFGIRFPVG